jgi:hypothetical protein
MSLSSGISNPDEQLPATDHRRTPLEALDVGNGQWKVDICPVGFTLPQQHSRCRQLEGTMGESELIGIIRDTNVQYASLFGQMITINFAMIVAIYYFLHRASIKLKVSAFAFYLIGMLSLIGLMLTEANLKYSAIRALAKLPRDHLSPVGQGYLAFRVSWLAVATAVFINISMWVLVAVIVYLLFWWRDDRRKEGGAPAAA